MSKMTRAEALDWIARTFEEPPGSLTPETSRDQIAAWDSLGILTFMANLDQDFGLVLPAGEVQDFRNVGEVLEMLARRGQLAD
ncbi:MAG: acyl carrier protein [Verrucomicrobiales bacterium]|nr:acyl carrier protein [Verrucomicrobiales bacterium]